jgi:hypothetical protein
MPKRVAESIESKFSEARREGEWRWRKVCLKGIPGGRNDSDGKSASGCVTDLTGASVTTPTRVILADFGSRSERSGQIPSPKKDFSSTKSAR